MCTSFVNLQYRISLWSGADHRESKFDATGGRVGSTFSGVSGPVQSGPVKYFGWGLRQNGCALRARRDEPQFNFTRRVVGWRAHSNALVRLQFVSASVVWCCALCTCEAGVRSDQRARAGRMSHSAAQTASAELRALCNVLIYVCTVCISAQLTSRTRLYRLWFLSTLQCTVLYMYSSLLPNFTSTVYEYCIRVESLLLFVSSFRT